MKVEIHMLRFYVQTLNPETGENREEAITLTKEQLRAAGLIGLSSKEIITRLCEGWGLKVLEIGKAKRHTVAFNLNALWDSCMERQETEAKWNYLYGGGAD